MQVTLFEVFSPSGGAYLFLLSSLLSNYSVTEDECMPYLKRLKRYCHTSLLATRWRGTTQEGHFIPAHTDFESYELVHVHIVIRHGDRTPATELPQISLPEIYYECGLSGEVYTSVWATQNMFPWDGLNDFSLQATTESVKNGKLKLHPGSEEESCGVGDLTSVGYLQLLNLGTRLQMMYGTLFAEMDVTSDLYVQSTDFRRTIRSAGAFLLGFVPNVKKLREMIKIYVQPGNLNQQPPEEIPLTYGTCKTILRMREAERVKRGYYTSEKELHWMYEDVVNLFGLNIPPKTPWTELFDRFTTRGCHSLGHTQPILPCTESNTCINCDLGKKLFDYADWSMSEKYPRNSSLIAVTPFLKHSLLETMQRTISEDPQSYKMMLTFTHDSMLKQLLKALGIPQTEWMPYASRLSFELWNAIYLDGRVTYFVRVLFNGEVVTHLLPFFDSKEEELVDYRTWQSSIEPISVETYNKLCGI